MNENPISEKPKKSLSFSEYSTYISCPHKWYLNYYCRFPGDVSEELLFGSSLHNTIESIFTNKMILRLYRMNKERTIQDVFVDCLKKELERVEDTAFLQNFAGRKLAPIFLFQARDLILKLDFERKFKDYEIVHVEFKLDGLPIHEQDEFVLTYKGFVDLILKHKVTGKYLILDWKTSRKAWDIKKKMADNPDLFAQLCLYKHFYSHVSGVDMDKIDTKYYNFPRDEADKQSFYTGILNKTYVDTFFNQFKNVAIKIYQHSQSLKEFDKAKHTTPKNFCFRCKYNTPDLCSDDEQHQFVAKPEPKENPLQKDSEPFQKDVEIPD